MTQSPAFSRRHFVGFATSAALASPLGFFSATARAADGAPGWTMKTVRAGDLEIGYAEAGPANGEPVLLLHGWPYDIHMYEGVSPRLAAEGFRVLVPYVRGCGTTRFLSATTARNGQQAAQAADAVALLDALGLRQVVVGGCDWGARTACILAALWPERFRALVSVSGYLVANPATGGQPLPPAAELSWWYQFYLATERGRLGYDQNRRAFARLIWEQASPQWRFDEATFNRTAGAFDNPDHVAVVVHNYRWRMGLAEGESRFDAIEARLAAAPAVKVPTITLEGDANGAPHPAPSAYARKFTGRYEHRTLTGGIGHNLPQEAPEAFAKAVIDVARA